MRLQPSSPWQRFVEFVKTHKKVSIICAVLIVLLIGSGVAFVLMQQKPKEQPKVVEQQPKPEPPKPPEPPKYFSPLTGVQVPNEATTKAQVRAVMIENSPSARPQSGLKEAGVVFEAIAEGGITRFLALYQDTGPGLIGPVRSLRPYYIDWLAPFNASISHVGGSRNALTEIRNGKYKDIDQFFNGGYYWRAADRYAPHNVYTSTAKLNELNQKKGYTSSTFKGFDRKAETPSPAPTASAIDIAISSATYNVHYDYDKASNSYVRSVGGKPHVDREVGQIQPKVVIAMKVETQLGFEDGYREQMATLGSGKAYIFQDGTMVEGTWHKPDKISQIEFRNEKGISVALNPGQTWISVTAPEKEVTWR